MFIYEIEVGGDVAICHKQASIPAGAVWKEVDSLPNGERSSLRISGGVVVSDTAIHDAVALVNSNAASKVTGVLYDGVMCSATANDMAGLASIRDYVLAGNNTRFEFDNGNSVLLTAATVAAFEAIWIPFRQSFFATV